jgi:hypothetical protein
MTQWIERIRGHGVVAVLDDLGVAIDAAVAVEQPSAETLASVERIRTVLAYAGQRIAELDPALILPSTLDSISSGATNAASELRQFVASSNAGHVSNANSHADSMLAACGILPAMLSPGALAAINKSATQYRTSTEKALASTQKAAAVVAESFARTAERVQEVSSDLSALKQRTESLVNEFQSQFSRSQDTRAQEHTDKENQRAERFQTAISELTEQSKARLSELSELRDSTEEHVDTELQLLIQKYSSESEAIVRTISGRLVEVEKLVGVIGNLGVTSGYVKAATNARSAKWFWQVMTLAAFGGLIWFAYHAFLPVIGNDFSWPSFAGRAVLTIAVGLLAAYTAAQADKASQLESFNDALALELQAIGPFLAPLSEEQQNEFRIKVGERTFGNHHALSKDQGKSSPTSLIDLLKEKNVKDLLLGLVDKTK